MSLTGSLIDRRSYTAVQRELQSELDGKTRRLVPASPQLRAALEQGCFPLWRELYGPWSGEADVVAATEL
jgi:hypothetical protein